MGVYSELGSGPTRLQRLAVRGYRWAFFRRAMQLFRPVRRPRKWAFVVGCYNSGTTLLQHLAGWHANISVMPAEGAALTPQLARPEDFGWTRMWCECFDKVTMAPKVEPQKAQEIVRDWTPFLNPNRSVFLEKSVANVTRMEWLDANFDNAHFIGIIRNPYPVCEGIRRQTRSAPGGNGRFGSSYPIETTAKQWAAANALLRENEHKVGRFMLVRYEDLTADPVGELRRLFRFLDEPLPGMKLEDRRFSMNGKVEVIRCRNQESIARLESQDIDAINRVLGTRIQGNGYEPLCGQGGCGVP